MKGKVRNAIIIAAGVLILTVMLTVVLYYYNDKVMRDNACIPLCFSLIIVISSYHYSYRCTLVNRSLHWSERFYLL